MFLLVPAYPGCPGQRPLNGCCCCLLCLWTDIYPTNIISQWRDEWKLAVVVISSLVDDPTIQQPEFNLPRRHWALLDCFRTDAGHCAFCQKKWGLVATDMCPNVIVSCTLRAWPNALLKDDASLCMAPWSGTPCQTTSAHSRTVSPLDRA